MENKDKKNYSWALDQEFDVPDQTEDAKPEDQLAEKVTNDIKEESVEPDSEESFESAEELKETSTKDSEKEKVATSPDPKDPAITLEKEGVTQFKNPLTSLFNKKIDVAFGMDISNGSIEMFEFSSVFSHKPRCYSRVILEEGTIEDGVIIKKDKLKEKIESLLQNARPVKASTNRVVLSLPEPQLYSWSTTIDKSVSQSDLKTVIYEESKKFIPLDYKKIYWDQIVYDSANKQNYNVTFFAIEKKVLDDYVLVCNEVGLDVVDFSLSATNVARVFLPLDISVNSMIVEIGSDHTNVLIFKGNRSLKLFVTNSIGGDVITEAIVQNLGLTNLEAEEMKKKFGLTDSGQTEYLQAAQTGTDKIFKEIREALDFYEKESGEKIDKIFLSGGGAMLKGIGDWARKYFNRDISSLSNIPLISNSDIFDEKINLQLYSGAIGLAISGIAKEKKPFSFAKRVETPPFKMSTLKVIKTGNFSKNRMIFSLSNVVKAVLLMIIIGVVVFASLVALSVDWSLVLNN